MIGLRRLVLSALAVTLAVAAADSGSASSAPGAAIPLVGSISGSVISSTTLQGLSGSVEFRDIDGFVVGRATLDNAGNYSINLPAGSYAVFTQNTDGYINEFNDNIKCSATCDLSSITRISVTNAPVTGVDFVLDPGGRISGNVKDTQPNPAIPVAGILVYFYDSTGTFPFTKALTDANGNYISEGGTGTGSVYAATENTTQTAFGYVNAVWDGASHLMCNRCSVTEGTPIAVTDGVTTSGIDFSMVFRGLRIAGTVRDGAGVGIPNVTVNIYDIYTGQTPWPLVDSVLTDLSGNYVTGGQLSLPNPQNHTWVAVTSNSLGLVDVAYDDVLCPGSLCIVNSGIVGTTPATGIGFSTGAATSNVDFTLRPGGRFTGKVADQSNAPVSLTGGTQGVALYDALGNLIGVTSTGNDGVYTTPALPPGRYYAQVINATGFGNQLYQSVVCGGCSVLMGTPIDVTAGSLINGVNFGLSSAGTIAGTVTDTGSGTPLTSAPVEILSTAGTLLKSVLTNGSGQYSASGLAVGSYYVRTHYATHVNKVYNNVPCVSCDVTTSGASPVSVVAGAITSNVNFSIQLGASILGTVTRASDGAPAPGVVVQVFDTNGVLIDQHTTNSSGVYNSFGFPAGNYYVRTQSEYLRNELYNGMPCVIGVCWPGGTLVSAVVGGTTGINFSLQAGGNTIPGNVQTTSHVGLPGVTVQAFDTLNRLVGTATTSEFGGFDIRGLPDGNYFIRTSNSLGYIDETYDNAGCATCAPNSGTPITLPSAQGLILLLEKGNYLTGTVRDASTLQPLSSTAVGVFNADGQLVRTGTSIANGRYVIGGLTPGTYYARTMNRLGYKDKIFDGVKFCDPSCLVTDGMPITVTAGTTNADVDFNLQAGVEMLQNPGFSAGLANWSLFATPDNSYLVSTILNGAFHYFRANPPPGSTNSAVILQNTHVAVATGDPVLVQFDLANTSDVRKRISVLVHEGDFSDLSVCTFWIAANTGPLRYGMLTHPTRGWTNATVSLYAASADSAGGAYQLDNVTMQTVGGGDIAETQCIDPTLPAANGAGAGPELLVNAAFSTGDTQGWTLFGQIASQVTAGVFEFIRPAPAVEPAGVIFQPTGAAASAGDRFTAHFDLGNSSGVRKRVTVLLHDLDFSDLTACTFWLEPNTPLSAYSMVGFATKAWTNTTLSIYAASPGNEQWMRLDNVSLKKTPSSTTLGTGCFEPGSTQPAGPAQAAASFGVSTGLLSDPITATTTTTSIVPADRPASVVLSPTGDLRTPWAIVDLTQSASATLTFESRFGGGAVEILIDGIEEHTFAAVPESDDWLETALDLTAYAGHKVQVRFLIDPASDASGWQIRNVVFVRRP